MSREWWKTTAAFFPRNDAVLGMRLDLSAQTQAALVSLEGRIAEPGLQSMPWLAPQAFLIAILGRIGLAPALLALLLYALPSIVRSTVAGLAGLF